MITPTRGRKHTHTHLQMITPTRGRKRSTIKINIDIIDSLQMITPTRGRKRVYSTTKKEIMEPSLQMITPIRGRKLFVISIWVNRFVVKFADDNPDKGTI